ncbi:ribonuclease inhibitor-like isoform X3 [Ptychodera flava]|uniref:ribonuclease inhibitor-like isoform X3 n=1 Tax=Ptychodera flava TaxID=63121 RepID=UPI00396A61E7
MSASTVQSLVETAAKCSADNITKIGYNALIDLPRWLLLTMVPYFKPFDFYQIHDIVSSKGIDTESYWKDHTMQRWPRRYSYNSQWFQKGFEGVDPMTEDDSYWREKYVQGHCIDALRSLVLSKANVGFEVDGLATILQGILERDEVNKLKHVEISDTPSLPRDHLIELVKLCIRCDNCQLQTLRFENLGLTTYPSLDQQPRLFSEKTFSNFTTPFELTCYLNLSGINLGYREDVASLCYLIRNDAALRHLILSDCYLSPDNLNAIFHAVQDAGRLQSLDVSANHYDGDDDGQLVDMLNESGVQRLNLNACHLRGQFSSGLIQALKNNRKLKMLWIAENRLGDDGLDKLSPVFAGEDSLSQIEILDISCNCISVEPLLKFTSSLKSTSKKITLREVSVFGNWFGEDQDMVSFIHKQLSEMIETVRTSTLYQSTFSSVTAEHISQM